MTLLGVHMAREINEQSEMFQRILDNSQHIIRVAHAIRDTAPRTVLFAGRGTSDHAALYAKYLTEIELGLPAGLMSPSTITTYGARPNLKDVLVIVVSQSGGSPDLVETATVARECGATVLAVTNNPDSALVSAVNFHINVFAGPELAVAATKSFTAQMLSLRIFFDAWLNKEHGELHQLPERASLLASRTDEFDVIASSYNDISRLVVTGRGYAYPTALEAALKIMETTYLDAHAFSGADLLHGPMALIDETHPVIAIAPDGKAFSAMQPVLERLTSSTDRLFVLSGAQGSNLGNMNFTNSHNLGEDLSPLLDIIAMQNIILRMAVNRGINPDEPRGLKKVTQTW